MPVPVPATANIAAAQGLELTLRDVEGEMVTPTGAAIAAAFRTEAALPKKYQIEKIGIGAGNKDFAHANILRAMLLTDKTVEVETGKDGHDESSMWVMEANLDDCTGEALGYAMEVLLEAGARDVWYTPAYMKKNRPAYVASCTDNGRKTGRIRTACLLLYDHDRCAPLSSREDDTATGSKGDPDPLRGSKGKNLQARRRGYVLSGV